MLVVFSGLPGTGKTTLARELAKALRAQYLRIDSIELALHKAGVGVGAMRDKGYAAACAVALDNLRAGHAVVVDAVNPTAGMRELWRRAAARSGKPIREIEVLCSDKVLHRARLEARENDLSGFVPPSWEEVLAREFEPWGDEVLRVDTAKLSPEQAVFRLIDCLKIADLG